MIDAGVVVSAERLTRVFPGPTGPAVAVSDVSFTLQANQVLGIIGANGAGKTTLIDLLAGVVAPTSGRAWVAKPLGYVPSGGRSFYPRLTVLHNLEFFAALHGLCRPDARERAGAALRLVGASEVRDLRADRLSDGMSARANLARALSHDPVVLLLDEPARSIDPVYRPSVLRAIRDYVRQPGKAAIMVTHNINDVFEICDAVAVMQQGRLVSMSGVSAGASDTGLLRSRLERELS